MDNELSQSFKALELILKDAEKSFQRALEL
jgi:hypothetical protein